jgi:glyoxylase-like metal-dependent hydrolase (beta-lactamase superfamily II)
VRKLVRDPRSIEASYLQAADEVSSTAPVPEPRRSQQPAGRGTLGTVVRALLVLIAASCVACGPARFAVVRDRARAPSIEVRQLHLEWSNVFLVRGESGAILVDSGSPGDWDELVDALRAEGVDPSALRLAVLTHGHADHAGLAARLQQAGVPIALGNGDTGMASRGRDDPLRSTSVLGDVLRPFVDFPYTAFAPDVVVTEPLDLAEYGVPGAEIVPLPGHTPGSVVVRLGADEAIVGDVMIGGLGSDLGGGIAGEHFYQADPARNHCNVQRLLDEGVERFYVGHGGPIDAPSVLGWRATEWRRDAARCAARR